MSCDFTKLLKLFPLSMLMEEYSSKCHGYRYFPAIIGAVERCVVFGDIHGDYNLTVRLLTASKVAMMDSDRLVWIGGTTHVVQIGDQIDRCRPIPGQPCDDMSSTYHDENSDLQIMELFNDLDRQAAKYGGAVISLLGNHELMNVLGIMTYVSYEGIKQFETSNESGLNARIDAFKPGGKIATMLGCTRMPAIIIGSNLFVHAGIVDRLIGEINLNCTELEKINIAIRRWLFGSLDGNAIKKIVEGSDTSMFWTRLLGMIPAGVSMTDPRCYDNIHNVMKIFKINHMIIGHTPQSIMQTDINSTCDGKIWRVDCGSSNAFAMFDRQFLKTETVMHNRRLQYLEIIDDNKFFLCDEMGCRSKI